MPELGWGTLNKIPQAWTRHTPALPVHFGISDQSETGIGNMSTAQLTKCCPGSCKDTDVDGLRGVPCDG